MTAGRRRRTACTRQGSAAAGRRGGARACRPPSSRGRARAAGPAVTASSCSRPTATGWRGRKRVCGWRRHTSVATAWRSRWSESRSASEASASSGRGPSEVGEPPSPPKGSRSARAEPEAMSSMRSRSDAVPRQRHDPDGQVGGLDVRRLGGVGKTAGIARQSPRLDDHGRARPSPSSAGEGWRDRRAPLDGTLGAGQGGPHPPPLAPGELHDDDVVEVEVDVEPALGRVGSGRR